MMSELQLMNDMPESYKSLLAQLEPETNLSGGSSGSSSRRLSIRGGVFRNVINGKEVGELDARSLNAVIVNPGVIVGSVMLFRSPRMASVVCCIIITWLGS